MPEANDHVYGAVELPAVCERLSIGSPNSSCRQRIRLNPKLSAALAKYGSVNLQQKQHGQTAVVRLICN